MHTPLNTAVDATTFEQICDDYELYRYGALFSDEIFFKIDIKNDSVRFLGSNLKYFKNREVIPHYREFVLSQDIIHADDRATFAQAAADLANGVVSPIRFRLIYGDKIIWYEARYTILYDDTDMPDCAIGKVRNIQQTQELEDKAKLDLLTTCLNKGTFEAYADTLMNGITLHENEHHAVLIIDIDNFKAINDNLGHFFGDIVLREISAKLKRIFRESDYIGRIGGDEFGVIMKNVSDEAIIVKKANAVLEALDATYHGNNTVYTVSGSVGVAVYPQHGNSYNEIYKNADSALFHSKFTGKNKFTLFNDSITKGTMVNSTPFDVANRALSHFFNQDLVMDIFNLLFAEENYDASLNNVLRHLGEHFNVDRCYVFELTPNTIDSYDNTYEWCREGIEPQQDFCQKIPLADFGALFDEANEEGVFYCNNIHALTSKAARETLEVQGIQSLLHTYIKKNDIVNFAIGYDDCTAERVWSPTEISTLLYASKIIAQFLAYKNALVKVSAKAQEGLRVMDSLNFFAYIVDYKNHSLKYVNAVTKQLVPDALLGAKCHKAMRNFDTECPDCPLRLLRENPDKQRVKMMIHNAKLDLDVLVTASKLISYDGRESVFLSSTDIKELVHDLSPNACDFAKYTVLD